MNGAEHESEESRDLAAGETLEFERKGRKCTSLVFRLRHAEFEAEEHGESLKVIGKEQGTDQQLHFIGKTRPCA